MSLDPRKRDLSTDEIELWLRVTNSVHPRKDACKPSVLVPTKTHPQARLRATLVDNAPKSERGRESPRSEAPLVKMERRHRSKISRGQWSIDSALDLHGMRQDEAHDTLRDFLFREHARGSRLVLVVTGVGRRAMSDERSPWFDEPGVLRRQTPHWLRAPDIRHVVMGFETASANHGGVGALYVRLRGSRR